MRQFTGISYNVMNTGKELKLEAFTTDAQIVRLSNGLLLHKALSTLSRRVDASQNFRQRRGSFWTATGDMGRSCFQKFPRVISPDLQPSVPACGPWAPRK